MGKASKRKSLRRQGIGPSHQDVLELRALEQMVMALESVEAYRKVDELRIAVARTVWTGGIDPPPVVLQQWSEDSTGDRFFSAAWAQEARRAPMLAHVKLPSADVLQAEPAHWEIAIRVLLRGIVLDGVPVDDPLVSEILGMLGPVAAARYAIHVQDPDDDEAFAELSDPLFVLGGVALIDGIWAIVGDDRLDPVLDLLAARLGDPLAAAGFAAAPDARVIAETLVRALTLDYRFDEPGDAQTLNRIGWKTSGVVLLDLIDAGHVELKDSLRLGLVVLAALADLARTDARSVLPTP